MRPSAPNLPLSDYPFEHPYLGTVASQCGGGEPVSVKREPTGPRGGCYYNVLKMKEKYGGDIELGWMLEWIPGVFIQMMHHAIWISPDSERRDVSFARENDQICLTSFVPDSSIPLTLDRPMQIANRYRPLTQDIRPRKAIRAHQMNDAAVLARWKHRLKMGMKWDWRTGRWTDPIHVSQSDADQSTRIESEIRRTVDETRRWLNKSLSLYKDPKSI